MAAKRQDENTTMLKDGNRWPQESDKAPRVETVISLITYAIRLQEKNDDFLKQYYADIAGTLEVSRVFEYDVTNATELLAFAKQHLSEESMALMKDVMYRAWQLLQRICFYDRNTMPILAGFHSHCPLVLYMNPPPTRWSKIVRDIKTLVTKKWFSEGELPDVLFDLICMFTISGRHYVAASATGLRKRIEKEHRWIRCYTHPSKQEYYVVSSADEFSQNLISRLHLPHTWKRANDWGLRAGLKFNLDCLGVNVNEKSIAHMRQGLARHPDNVADYRLDEKDPEMDRKTSSKSDSSHGSSHGSDVAHTGDSVRTRGVWMATPSASGRYMPRDEDLISDPYTMLFFTKRGGSSWQDNEDDETDDQYDLQFGVVEVVSNDDSQPDWSHM